MGRSRKLTQISRYISCRNNSRISVFSYSFYNFANTKTLKSNYEYQDNRRGRGNLAHCRIGTGTSGSPAGHNFQCRHRRTLLYWSGRDPHADAVDACRRHIAPFPFVLHRHRPHGSRSRQGASQGGNRQRPGTHSRARHRHRQTQDHRRRAVHRRHERRLLHHRRLQQRPRDGRQNPGLSQHDLRRRRHARRPRHHRHRQPRERPHPRNRRPDVD